MEKPKDILTFVVIEFLVNKGFLGTAIVGVKKPYDFIYSKEDIKVSFNKSRFQLPFYEVETILNKAGYTVEDFKNFCEVFLTSPDYELAMKNSVVNVKPDK